MNFEEFKNSLLTSHGEGVDSAAVYDSLLTEVSGLYEDLKVKTEAVEELTNRLAESNASNMKLLDKIKYMAVEETPEDDKDEPELLTIEQLFE